MSPGPLNSLQDTTDFTWEKWVVVSRNELGVDISSHELRVGGQVHQEVEHRVQLRHLFRQNLAAHGGKDWGVTLIEHLNAWYGMDASIINMIDLNVLKVYFSEHEPTEDWGYPTQLDDLYFDEPTAID